MAFRLPQKRKPPRKAPKKAGWPIRCRAHLTHIRGLECLLRGQQGHVCTGEVRACHLRQGTDGGMGVKPSDCWTWPGCDGLHAEQHQIGEAAFQDKYGLDLRDICAALWQRSDAGRKWRYENK